MMGYDYGTWGTGQWLATGTTMMLFMVLTVGVVVWAVRGRGDGVRLAAAADPADPLRVLEHRFARGEIEEEEEYLRRRAVLLR